MQQLIGQIRAAIPFDRPAAQVCTGDCQGCSRTLLEFLQTELDAWECRLNQGECPGLGELSRLARIARRIHRVLKENSLIEADGVQ